MIDANDLTTLASLDACALLIELARGSRDLATMGDRAGLRTAYGEAQVVYATLPLVARLKLTTEGPAAAIALLEQVAAVEATALRPHLRDHLADDRPDGDRRGSARVGRLTA